MCSNSFGEYFRKLRLKKGKTQEEIAKLIGKSKMLISGVETGKNKSFCENDLKMIINGLELSESEKVKLVRFSARSMNKMPNDMTQYLCNNDKAFELVSTVMQMKFSEEQLQSVVRFCMGTINKENENV